VLVISGPGFCPSKVNTILQGFAARGTPSGLIVPVIHSIPELSLRSNSGLKLANAFGVFLFEIQTDALPGTWLREVVLLFTGNLDLSITRSVVV
jgi:hypothetical protein